MAEYLLYYHDFEFIDDLYLTFAKSVADATWVKKEVRNHYSEQIKRLKTSKLGEPLYDFEYTSITGARKHLSDNQEQCLLYVVMFSDSDSGSSIERMRLSTDMAFGKLLRGLVKVINIVAGRCSQEVGCRLTVLFIETWEVGASKDVASKLDMRIMPCIYVLDENFKCYCQEQDRRFCEKHDVKYNAG